MKEINTITEKLDTWTNHGIKVALLTMITSVISKQLPIFDDTVIQSSNVKIVLDGIEVISFYAYSLKLFLFNGAILGSLLLNMPHYLRYNPIRSRDAFIQSENHIHLTGALIILLHQVFTNPA